MNHVVILNVVGLSSRHFERPEMIPNLAAFARRGRLFPMRPSFPAVTCSVQATLLSGKPPSQHGIVANGCFNRETFEVKFWEQPAALVQAPRLWDMLPGCKTAVLFWQNSMFAHSDIIITPRPLHLDSGLMQWCYSKPAGYYEEVAREIGDFKLQSYWGPVASLASSRWIGRAARFTWRKHKPNLLLAYLPHLDYSSQKFGPDSPQAQQAMREIDALVGELLQEFSREAEVIVCSEYSLTPVNGALYPNRLLRDAGLLRVREIAGKEYLDFELSDAFAMVDHQIAHIYCKSNAIAAANQALEGEASAEPRRNGRLALQSTAIEFTHIDHPRSGELVAIAPRDKWFAYYWWKDWAKAPEFACTVDIHRKPGYDPCELWFDWPRFLRTHRLPTTATNPELVKGSHGRVDNDPAGWAALIIDEKVASAAPAPARMDATDLAPLVCRLLLG
ncbi:MAG TPA: alkaline phosphatase family protein [Verrucomicrobiae bacterium]|nr:alkaline phosphatase family protein [Verrucomicrobiae bacterium]